MGLVSGSGFPSTGTGKMKEVESGQKTRSWRMAVAAAAFCYWWGWAQPTTFWVRAGQGAGGEGWG